MPYRGDSPTEAWEYFFDETPSETACSSLERFAKNHVPVTIIEAIRITYDKRTVTSEAARLRYINGVLQRKTLQTVAPERAEEERQIDLLQRFWQKHGTPFQGYWHQGSQLHRNDRQYFRKDERAVAASWLRFCTVAEIEAVMSVARSWIDLCDVMGEIEARQARTERRVVKTVFRDLTIILTEFVTSENAGFVLTFQNAKGEEFGDADITPRRLEDAKIIAGRRAVEYVDVEYVSADFIVKAVKDSWVETTVPHGTVSASFTV
jgi:hypothetical protein